MGEMRNAYKVWSENLKDRNHSEDVGVDGIRETEWQVVHRIHMTQDRDKWLALVNTVINHQFLKRQRISWLISF
jgi:hypothetical protein